MFRVESIEQPKQNRKKQAKHHCPKITLVFAYEQLFEPMQYVPEKMHDDYMYTCPTKFMEVFGELLPKKTFFFYFAKK